MLPKESFLCHGPFVWEQRCDLFVYQKLCDRRVLVSCIHYHCFDRILFQLFVKFRECLTVMLVSGVHTVIKDSPIFITCGLDRICEYFFVFSFVKPAAFRIGNALLLLFQFTHIHLPAPGISIIIISVVFIVLFL